MYASRLLSLTNIRYDSKVVISNIHNAVIHNNIINVNSKSNIDRLFKIGTIWNSPNLSVSININLIVDISNIIVSNIIVRRVACFFWTVILDSPPGGKNMTYP